MCFFGLFGCFTCVLPRESYRKTQKSKGKHKSFYFRCVVECPDLILWIWGSLGLPVLLNALAAFGFLGLLVNVFVECPCCFLVLGSLGLPLLLNGFFTFQFWYFWDSVPSAFFHECL